METKTRAWRRSVDVSTPVTVTKPIRGSLSCPTASERTWRTDSLTRRMRWAMRDIQPPERTRPRRGRSLVLRHCPRRGVGGPRAGQHQAPGARPGRLEPGRGGGSEHRHFRAGSTRGRDRTHPFRTDRLGALLVDDAAIDRRRSCGRCAVRGDPGRRAAPRDREQRQDDGVSAPAAVLWGAAIGLLGGFVGLILGALRIGALLRFVRADAFRAVGTNLAVGFCLGVAGVLGHLTGGVDWTLLAVGAAASIPGSLLGSRLTGRLNERQLMRAIGAVLVVAGGATIAQGVV